ncbi:hypothetical protein GYMLUDRAFT_51328 [Collybiopsis luxurians FD-317 M1]|uniref:Uncharacterized protein n=1 Tax=Collybiopsis luxurians FD-317 M1 TaxID=944289 RepID=A0A0D0BXQ0_9AGAR|nr:hypothetical protein GYMLUDRAFT_51328 [Collybiopsis luxurians FD-317 M1]
MSTVQHSNTSSPPLSTNLVALEYTFNRLDTENEPYSLQPVPHRPETVKDNREPTDERTLHHLRCTRR